MGLQISFLKYKWSVINRALQGFDIPEGLNEFKTTYLSRLYFALAS